MEELTAKYGSDSALGVVHNEEEGASVLPDGGRAASCFDCAYYIRSLELNTSIYGFWSKDNSDWVGALLQDGHDFAVIDERYIVDPWMVETEALSNRAVFDLEDARDAVAIKRLYGNRAAWRLVELPSLPSLSQRGSV